MRPGILSALCLAAILRATDPISIALDKPVLSLDPLLLAREVEVQVVDLVFDRLVAIDEHGNYLPEMLESWEISKDGRNVLLKLRPGLTWQDGSPVEAEDVVATWRMLSLPAVRKVFDLVGVRTLDSVVAEGPLRIRIRLRQPRATLLADLYNFQPVPRKLYHLGADPFQNPLNYAPVGSGPYRVLPGATSRDIQIERWPGYRGPHPGRWDRFHFRVQPPDAADYLRQIRAGEYHFADLDWFHHYLLRQGALGTPGLQALSAPTASYDTFWLDCDPARSLLGDKRLRRALAELQPLDFLLAQRQLHPARLATSLWSPLSWAYEAVPQTLPKLDRARALLDAAGWHPGPDGVRRNANGRPLRLVMYATRGYSRLDAAEAFAALAKKASIDLDLRRVGIDEVLARAAKGEGDLWAYGWNTSLDPDAEAPLFTSEGIQGGTNVTRYHNPEVDRLFAAARHEMDAGRRRAMYRRINLLVQSDFPVVQLTYGVAYLAADRRLRGVAFDPLGQSYGYVPGRRGWTLAN
ncbi:peptide-binding protein [Geothrix rubra]|uniref:Peptide-binding protein n=1 Tax=Geothrix rubra TaxID=2927977 RepID=A0ABQ5Q415_9BACT|nr:ABC transporter substrate-binding protein [Geothrix rubra]GLH69165.1 peptide-binding protein [Geothrix rubra]